MDRQWTPLDVSLEDLLGHPGLDEQFLLSMAPVSRHRLCTACRGLHSLTTIPFRAPRMDLEVCEEEALELLQKCPISISGYQLELVLDELFLLTLGGRPTKVKFCPVRNLLDEAVHLTLRPVIPLLLKRGYALEFLDAYSLESLVQSDDVEGVAAYLEAGMNPDVRANAGRSVLMVAVASRAESVARLLLRWKANVNESSGFGQWTALMWAAHGGWEAGCALLLDAGAHAEDKNAQGLNATDIARQQNRDCIVSMLSACSN